MVCKNCGNPLGPNDVFCGECGHKVEDTRATVFTSAQPGNEETVSTHSSTNASQQIPKQDSAVHQEPAAHTQQQVHQQPTYVQHQQVHQQPAQPLIDKDQVNIQSRRLVDEGRNFFGQAFRNADEEIGSKHHFSVALSLALIIGGLILTGLILAIFSPTLLYIFGSTKSEAIFKLSFLILIYIAVMVGSIYVLSKFLINPTLSLAKVLSDFVLVNVFSYIIFFLGIFIISMSNESSFGYTLLSLSYILITYSAFYLFGKYSSYVKPKVSSFIAAIIHLIIITLVLYLFKDTFVEMIGTFFRNIITESVSDYFGS